MRVWRWLGSGAGSVAAGLFVVASATTLAAAPMATGGLTSQPIGHYEFCKINPAECSQQIKDPGPERMSGPLWRRLVAINAAVNEAVRPINDIDLYGREEVWAYPDQGAGDCEDYVLEKRRELARTGVSLANLLITVVRKPDGEGHAVLTVRTDGGDLVLDNLAEDIRQWDQTGYRYLKRQSSENTGRWVTIREEPSVPMVGAVNATAQR